MNNRKILLWEIGGMAFVSIVGSLFHFLFEWTNFFLPVAVIAPVNESVWEHLKLAYWPLLIFAAIEYRSIRFDGKNFVAAKLIGVVTMMVMILVFFYTYVGITGTHSLFFDILSFIMSIMIGQLVSYRLLTIEPFPTSTKPISWAFLLIIAVIFGVFTFFPPQIPLFEDSLTNSYGIVMNLLL